MKNNPKHQNLSDTFRELSLPDLKRYAGRWAKKFNDALIQRIALYRYSSKFQASLGGEVPTKFFVVFEVPVNYDDWEAYKEQLPSEVMEFQHADLNYTFIDLMDSSFEDAVYKRAPRENFKYEWRFFPKGPDEDLPPGVMADEPYWVLYEEGQQTPKSEALDLVSSENFIKSLKVSRVSNSEIKIKEPDKSPQVYDCKYPLGFKNETTREWKDLIEVLGNKDHVFSLGSSSKSSAGIKSPIRSYDAKRKRIIQINNKLIDFFNKKYLLQLPNDFKLYERCKDGRGGTYKFKFQVVDNSMDVEKTDYRSKSKEHLLKEFEQLAEKYKENIQDEKVTMELTTLSKFLREKEWITKEEITKAIKGFRDTEIIFNPYENVKDISPQY